MKNLFLFLLCFVTLNGFAQQTVTYSFAPHQQIESGAGFSELIIENCSYISEEGHPDLPVFSASVLLAPGHEIASINIINIEYYPAIENINIRPASANFPISKGAPAGYKAVPKPEIYSVNQNYPENTIAGENTSFLRGHAIGSFLIYPVLFNPVQKRAMQIKTITLEVYSEATPKAVEALRFLRNDIQTAERIKQTTANRDEAILNSYNSLSKRSANPNYELLIVTKQAFVPALDNYIKHKNLWGYKVLVKTVEEIYTTYTTGIDNADRVRQCVIDAYENEGISYLMFFGDSHQTTSSPHNSIPYRRLYCKAGNEIDNLPSDMYFACFDGTWYNSSSGLWGEYGYNDLDHEISVGRLCADNVNEIETFVAKLIKYQETPVVEDIKKALMVGENLDGVPTWGGDCKDQIAVGGSYNGYTTVGLPSDYTINKLYDKNGYWNTTQLRNYFNNTGAHFVNHLGHSDVTYNMKLDNSDITNAKFTNDGIQRTLSIVYSQGCLNGAFDNKDGWGWDHGDCINEMFHKINGGVVANIGNSRYGWYNPGGTNGPSQRFDRYFFDGIFGQNIYNIGDANTYSKDKIKGITQNDAWVRWCCYELNLMGDPSMDIWTDTPTEFDPQYIDIVKNSDIEIKVSTGVPYARVAILQNDELVSRGQCDEAGNVVLTFDAPLDLASALLSLTGHNKFRFEQQGLEFVETPPVRELTASVDEIVVTLEWQEPDYRDDNQPDSYAIYRNGNRIITLSSDELSYQDTDELSWNTTYDYCVRALYSVFASPPVCLPVKTDPYCALAGNVRSSVSKKAVALQWEQAGLIAPKEYTVFRDGEFLKETTKLFIIDNVPEDDTEYEYCVVAQYDDCELEPVCLKVIVGSPVGISEAQTEGVHIYPNPTTGELRITNYELRITNIEVFDVFGRKVEAKFPSNLLEGWQPQADGVVLDISHLQSGIYFVKVFTEEGEVVKKVIKQ
jgi:hypothetical protein